ncbi:ABC-2 type transporter-domain-containing protein [Xylaria nigripes]|nr:ABC-2 type transporter-domain-containing protein [Xylaria nigripes]
MWSPPVPGDGGFHAPNSEPMNQWHRDSPPEDDARISESDATETIAAEKPMSETPDLNGTWGERDVGEVDEEEAHEQLQELRQTLSRIHQTRTHETQGSRRFRWSNSRGSDQVANQHNDDTKDSLQDDTKGTVQDGNDDFELDEFMRGGKFEKRAEDGSQKRVGVTYRNLTVKGTGGTISVVRTVPDAIIGSFGPDLYRIITKYFPKLRFRKPPTRTLIHDFTGCVRDGEMMLVLGRPGSGCSTFLKAIANNRDSYAAVEGHVSYGGIPAEKQKHMYRGEVTYNPEDDVHHATLNVWQTITFALLNKTKKAAVGDIPTIANSLMKMFGISHTKLTRVGNEFIRGVSGGERKRVSIVETLASKATVMAWDNSTRGLDASTALDYARSLRIMTDITNRTTLVTLYQAGEGIYELMDKVLVIDGGRQIYSGPAKEAKQYFIDLGFECPQQQTTADFLTAITDPRERRFRPGFEDKAPRSAEELEKAFRSSPYYQRLLVDTEKYEKHLQQTGFEDMKRFEGAVRESKSRHVSKKSPYTVSFPRQVIICTKREFWLLFGDLQTLATKMFIIISNALIIGSIYYNEPFSTAGAFTRGGACFFGVIFLSWLQLTELMAAVSGRAVAARQKDYAFYRPSAVSLGRVLADFPVLLVQVLVFSVIMYFMTNLDRDVSKFFIYLLFVYTTTIMATAFYRMFASVSPEIDTAVRFSGVGLNLLAIYTGYFIPKTQLLGRYIWFGWIYWINPLAYSFEAVLTNELSGRVMQCAPEQLVPRGPNVTSEFQGCLLAGSAINSIEVPSHAYLEQALHYSHSNLWRNFGVVIAFTVLYIAVTILATETLSFASDGGGALVFKKSQKIKRQVEKAAAPADVENNFDSGFSATSSSNGAGASTAKDEEGNLHKISGSESIFTWRDVEYTVPYNGGERKILNKVNGYAKPGVLVALVGASGAGKTTLLHTLAQRQRAGVVSGEMFVDGRPLGPEFQRGTGFCLQGDIHDGSQTIREAIEFSALLRQDAKTPRSEKLAYVDKVIDLLELNDREDAIISSLDVEVRKRLTIGVELAAKPSLLLFLDEPTSGLDAQSAFSIVSFLRKLARAGQAIVCTIHQPSSVLIQQFDMVLALNPGGNTFYFGPIGENGQDVIRYFEQRGAHAPPGKNVAEFILETAARPHKREDGTRVDWNEEWRNSEQAQKILEEIDGLKRIRSAATEHSQDTKQKLFTEYAASTWTQTVELTKRMFRQYWREPSYVYGKFFVAVIIGIFNGFTFWKLGNSAQDLQNRMFTSFLIVIIPPVIVNSVLPKYYNNITIWETREYPSRIYGWAAFCTANILAEIPPAIVSGTAYWLLWYLPTGLPVESSISGYVYLMCLLMFLFMDSWGQWICAFAPSFTVISNILPFFFVIFSLFNGIVQPYRLLPVFWRSWIYYVNPSMHWINGVVGTVLNGVAVECEVSETAQFNTPPGLTCQDYAGAFVDSAGGYLLNPNATADCQYCPYKSGNEFLSTLNIDASDKWRSFGIFLTFCISNWALIYFFIYTVRVRGWSFGFGYVFDKIEKLYKWMTKSSSSASEEK